MKYSQGFRASIVRKTQDGSGRSVAQIAKETGISVTTIANWTKKYQIGTLSLDDAGRVTPQQRNPGEKLSLLLESKTLSDEKKGEWLRQQGLHSEHLSLWEQELTTLMKDKQADLQQNNNALKKENKHLKRELERKEKALAEAAVLLTLKKKFHNLFANEDEET